MDSEEDSNSSPCVDQTTPELAQRPQLNTVPDVGSVPPPAGLFMGYSSVDGSSKSTAIKGTFVTAGGTSNVTYQLCENTESIYEALDISQSVSVGMDLFFGVKEKTNFVKTLKRTSHAITLVVKAKHVQGFNKAANFELTDDVKPPVDEKGVKEFFRLYGDSFVSEVTTGSEYYATFTFQSRSSEERNSTMAEIKAHGLLSAVNVGAELKTNIDKVKASSEVEVTSNHFVAGIKNPKLPSSSTPENMIQYAMDFLGIAIDSPAIISFGIKGYEQVPQITNFDGIAKNREYFNGGINVESLTTHLAKLEQLKKEIADLQSIYDFYKFPKDKKLNEMEKSVPIDIAAINKQIHDFLNDPLANFTRPPLGALPSGPPQLNPKFEQSPLWGGGGGSPFDDVDINTYLPTGTHITSVTINTGTYQQGKKKAIKKRRDYHTTVYQIAATYSTKDGSTSSVSHGSGGNPSSALQLAPGHFVTTVTGHSSNEVDRLELIADDGKKIAGGGEEGKQFSWKVPAGAVLLGFRGRSSARLNSIGASYVSLLPVKWA